MLRPSSHIGNQYGLLLHAGASCTTACITSSQGSSASALLTAWGPQFSCCFIFISILDLMGYVSRLWSWSHGALFTSLTYHSRRHGGTLQQGVVEHLVFNGRHDLLDCAFHVTGHVTVVFQAAGPAWSTGCAFHVTRHIHVVFPMRM
jgi:hypothetical protein